MIQQQNYARKKSSFLFRNILFSDKKVANVRVFYLFYYLAFLPFNVFFPLPYFVDLFRFIVFIVAEIIGNITTIMLCMRNEIQTTHKKLHVI